TVQVLNDTSDLGGFTPPEAPYAGTFNGPGPIIRDTPVSRFISVFTLPVLSIKSTATNSVVVSWPSSLTGWTLQQNSDLNTTEWTEVMIPPIDDRTNKIVTLTPPVGGKIFRLYKP